MSGAIILETDRLLLRHFHIFDLDAMTEVFTDREVMRFSDGVKSKDWVYDWLWNCAERTYQKWGFGPWTVVEKEQRQMLGYCGLFYFSDLAGQPEVEIGYRLARRFWGQGYATEAALSVRDYAFGPLCLSRLVALIDPANTASIKVAAKIGMRYEKEVMLEGYSHPDHLYVRDIFP